jgi:exosortase B
MTTAPPNTVVSPIQRVSPVQDAWVLWPVLLGFALLYVPGYLDLARSVWTTDEQGHGPIILGVSLWLLFSQRKLLAALEPAPAHWWGGVLLLLGLVSYVLGRSQSFLALEVVSQILVLCGLVCLLLGRKALRVIWFPLFFLVFMTPFPEALVAEVTGPLKSAVSVVAAELLYYLGYPVSRTGVMLNVGPYQLLVADACAGLNSMFTLEALGLLYLNIMKYTSAARNVTLAILVVPIAFVANIVRVMILVLVTYHFGDAAGQGFVHSFAGMLLFIVGLTMVLLADYFLGKLFFEKPLERKQGGVA